MPIRQPDRVPENVQLPHDFASAAALLNGEAAQVRGWMYKLADETWLQLLTSNHNTGEPVAIEALLTDHPPDSTIILSWRGIPVVVYTPHEWLILNHGNLPNIRAISDIIQRVLTSASGCELVITGANWPNFTAGTWTIQSFNCGARDGVRTTTTPVRTVPYTNMMAVCPATGNTTNLNVSVNVPATQPQG